MSSTGRGTVKFDADLYPTPKSAFDPLIPFLPRDGPIWEPAAGDFRLVRWMLEAGIDAWGTDLHLDDSHRVFLGFDAVFPLDCSQRDFLQDNTHRYCIVSNPPFSLAMEFCDHAVKHADHVFFLLRLNFLGSQTRKAWFQKHEPALFVLSDRPSFAMSVKCKAKCGYKTLLPLTETRPAACPSCGGRVTVTTSDSTEYAFFYWGPNYSGIRHL